jgi:hypothetical protein
MSGTYPANASVYPYGFKSSLVLRNVPLMQTQPGRVFWVNNSASLLTGGFGFLAASDSNDGSYYKPFATIQKGINACAANRGDIVMVGPNHAETIGNATTIQFNKAGVAVIGIGVGATRPTLTFSTATTANIPVTVANASVQNILHVGNFADVASAYTATGTATPTDFSIENCEFRDTSAILDFFSVFVGNATANSCDGFRFVGNTVASLTTTASRVAISLLSATNRVTITDNVGTSAILNDSACLLATSSFNLTNFILARNIWSVPNTSSTGGSFVSGSGTGWQGCAYDNYFGQVDNSAGIWISTGKGSSFYYFNNFSMVTGAVDKSALINPVAV